jgi:hypothetical protein
VTTQIEYDDETADGALIVVKIRHNKIEDDPAEAV